MTPQSKLSQILTKHTSSCASSMLRNWLKNNPRAWNGLVYLCFNFHWTLTCTTIADILAKNNWNCLNLNFSNPYSRLNYSAPTANSMGSYYTSNVSPTTDGTHLWSTPTPGLSPVEYETKGALPAFTKITSQANYSNQVRNQTYSTVSSYGAVSYYMNLMKRGDVQLIQAQG